MFKKVGELHYLGLSHREKKLIKISVPKNSILFKSLILAWIACIIPRLILQIFMWSEIDLRTSHTVFFNGKLVDTAIHDSYWPVLYGVLANILWLFSGGSSGLYKIYHLLIASIIGPLVYVISKRLKLGEMVCWLSVLGVAVLPYYAFLPSSKLDVGITVVLFATYVWTTLIFIQDYSLSKAFIHSFVGITLFLNRPNALSTILFGYAFALLWNSDYRFDCTKLRDRGKQVSSGLVIFLVLLTSWAAVNQYRFGYLTPFPSNGGDNLYMGNNPFLPEYRNRYDIPSFEIIEAEKGLPKGIELSKKMEDPYAYDKALRKWTIAFMIENPQLTLLNAYIKAIRYWDFKLEKASDYSRVKNASYSIPYLLYGPLALVGFALMLVNRRFFSVFFLTGVIISYWAPHLFFNCAIRMRMTTEFVLVILGSYAVTHMINLEGKYRVLTLVGKVLREKGSSLTKRARKAN